MCEEILDAGFESEVQGLDALAAGNHPPHLFPPNMPKIEKLAGGWRIDGQFKPTDRARAAYKAVLKDRKLPAELRKRCRAHPNSQAQRFSNGRRTAGSRAKTPRAAAGRPVGGQSRSRGRAPVPPASKSQLCRQKTKELQLLRRVELVTGMTPPTFRRHLLATANRPGSDLALITIAVPNVLSNLLEQAWPGIEAEIAQLFHDASGVGIVGYHVEPQRGFHANIACAGPQRIEGDVERMLAHRLRWLLWRSRARCGIRLREGDHHVFDWQPFGRTLTDAKTLCGYVSREPARGGAVIGRVPGFAGCHLQLGGKIVTGW